MLPLAVRNIALFLFLLAIPLTRASPFSSSPHRRREFRSDPYKILQVSSKQATQKEIQRQYRKLCLLHHPDKKRKQNRATVDDDFAFKEVQHAYSLIGDEAARRKYDESVARSRLPVGSSGAFGRTQQAPVHFSDPFEMFGDTKIYFSFGGDGRRTAFRFSPSGSPFARRGFYGTADRSSSRGTFLKKVRYVQKATIPLEWLYAGKEGETLTLQTSLIDKCMAAYRGGELVPVLLSSFLPALVIWLRNPRFGWLFPLVYAALAVYSSIPPPPSSLAYPIDVVRGWKQGTKIQYQTSENGISTNVTFVVQEGKHDRFRRVGDDLHTTLKLSAGKLKKGCTAYIEPICDTEPPIEVTVRPGEIKRDGQVIIVHGRGWPKASGSSQGDLHVKVRIARRKSTFRH